MGRQTNPTLPRARVDRRGTFTRRCRVRKESCLPIHSPPISFFHHSPAPRRRRRKTYKREQRFPSKSFLNTILPRLSSPQPSSSQPPLLPPSYVRYLPTTIFRPPSSPSPASRGKASLFPTMAFCLTRISRSTRASRAKEVSRALKSPSATSVSTANEAPGASKANRLAKTSRPTREKKDGAYYPTSARTAVVPG